MHSSGIEFKLSISKRKICFHKEKLSLVQVGIIKRLWQKCYVADWYKNYVNLLARIFLPISIDNPDSNKKVAKRVKWNVQHRNRNKKFKTTNWKRFISKNRRNYWKQNLIFLFLHSMEKKSTKVDFSPISCKKAPFYTRNGHF